MGMKLTEDNYVDQAEAVIRDLKDRRDRNGRPIPMLTTSKIRNILSMTVDLYTDILAERQEKLTEDEISRINYLKLRLVYECGRDRDVRNFAERAELLSLIEAARSSRQAYLLFSRYMEALVAYHRFYGGREN